MPTANCADGIESALVVEVEIGTGPGTVTTGGATDDGLIARTVDEAGCDCTGRA
ncbi:hypothetical protein [Streptomyces sp. WZ.A104]|uniref:hypothetical protein n=1 Tax=Streptomyces sp. WZ.A104 TaxID=2023771 RepID=UPI0015CB9439|nr:hypothetical protein [Streptomyces sp. WZ.A104]